MAAKEFATGTIEKLYAKIIRSSTVVGLFGLLVPFFLYVTGLVEAAVPFRKLDTVWVKPAKEYLSAAGLSHGWSWVRHIAKSDVMCFVGIAILAFCSVVALAAILWKYVKAKRRLYTGIILAEIVVLLAAISGVVAIG